MTNSLEVVIEFAKSQAKIGNSKGRLVLDIIDILEGTEKEDLTVLKLQVKIRAYKKILENILKEPDFQDEYRKSFYNDVEKVIDDIMNCYEVVTN